ncbi:hypothetical protein GCM10010199_13950 [Dactylosporangium roseum]
MPDPDFTTLRRELEARAQQPPFQAIRVRRRRRTQRLAMLAVAVATVAATTSTTLMLGQSANLDPAHRGDRSRPTASAPTPGGTATPTSGPSASTSARPSSTHQPPTAPTGGAGACVLPAYPTAACAGVPADTALTAVDGDLTIDVPNTVVDRKNIRGCVNVRAPGVVIRRSKVSCANFIAIASFAGAYTGTGLLIEDTEIDCRSTRGTAVGDTNFTARRVNVHGCENGFDVDTDVVIADSYIHDLYNSAEAGTDGIQFAIGRNVTVTHNTIYANGGTSAIITHPTTTTNVVISDNLLAGGAYTLYCPRDSSTNLQVVNNHFSRKFHPAVGAYGPWTNCEKAAKNHGNVYDDTGTPLAF